MADRDEQRSFEDKDPTHGKDTPAYKAKPGQEMLGDGTEEQNLDQKGSGSKVTKEDVEQALRDQGGQR
jgi:hypothetical protein